MSKKVKSNLKNASLGSQVFKDFTEAEISPDSDTMFKMSKKIAQLTKVVFFLNTKDEDNEAKVNSLTTLYEDEITHVISDAQSQISNLSDKNDNLGLELKAHEEAMKGYIDQVEAQSTQIEGYLVIEETLQKSVASLTKERDEATQLYADLTKTSDAIGQLRAKYESRITEINASHAIVLAENVAAFENEKIELRREIKEQATSFAEQKKSQRVDYENTLSTMAAEKDYMENNLAENIQDDRSKFEEDILTLREQMEDQRLALTEQVQLNNDEKEDMRGKYEAKLAENRDVLIETEGTIRELERSVDKQKLNFKRLENDYEEERHRANTAAEQLEATQRLRSEAEDTLLETKMKLETAERKLIEHEGMITDFSRMIEDLSNRLEFMTLEKDACRAKFIDTAQKLEDTTNEVILLRIRFEELQILQMKYKDLQESLNKTVLDHSQQINQIHAGHVLNMEANLLNQKESLDKEHEHVLIDKVNMLEKFHQDVVGNKIAIIETLETAIDKLKIDLKDQETALHQKYALEREKFEKQIAILHEDQKKFMARTENDKAELRGNIQELNQALDKKSLDIGALNVVISSLKQNVRLLEDDKADLIQRMMSIDKGIREEMLITLVNEKIQLNSEWVTKADAQLVDLERNLLEKFESDMHATVTSINTTHSTEIEELTANFAVKEQRADDEITQLVDEKTLLDENIKKLGEEMISTNGKFKGAISQLLADHQKSMEHARKEWDSDMLTKEREIKVQTMIAMANLEKKNNLVLAQQKIDSQKALSDLRANQAVSMLSLKQEAEKQKAIELTRIRADNAAEKASLESAHTSAMAELELQAKATTETSLLELEEKYENYLQDKEEELVGAKANLSERDSSIDDLEMRIQSLRANIIELNLTITNRNEELDREKQQVMENLSKREFELRAHYLTEIENLNNDHVSQLQTMLTEFEQAQIFLKKQIANQQKLLHQAELKYENREPREVDVKNISDLEEDIKRRKRRMQALLEDLDYYKLELNNREANFNKIFNKQPLVGVIQPGEYNKSKYSSRKALGYTDNKSDHNLNSRLPPLISAVMQNNESVGGLATSVSVGPPMSATPLVGKHRQITLTRNTNTQ